MRISTFLFLTLVLLLASFVTLGILIATNRQMALEMERMSDEYKQLLQQRAEHISNLEQLVQKLRAELDSERRAKMHALAQVQELEQQLKDLLHTETDEEHTISEVTHVTECAEGATDWRMNLLSFVDAGIFVALFLGASGLYLYSKQLRFPTGREQGRLNYATRNSENIQISDNFDTVTIRVNRNQLRKYIKWQRQHAYTTPP
jgi:hypothetical protein